MSKAVSLRNHTTNLSGGFGSAINKIYAMLNFICKLTEKQVAL